MNQAKSPAARIADRSILDEDLLAALEDELAALNKEAKDESDSIISGKEARGRGELVRPKSREWFFSVVASAERCAQYHIMHIGSSQAMAGSCCTAAARTGVLAMILDLTRHLEANNRSASRLNKFSTRYSTMPSS